MTDLAVPRGRLGGRTVVVTGAANGVGRSTAFLFASEGAMVIAVDIRPEIAQIYAGHAGFLTICCDITQPDAATRIVASAVDVSGRLDVLCNIAGIIDGFSLLDETTDAIWDRVMELNLKAPFRLARAALPQLLEAGGSIINVGSMAGTKGLPGPTYAAAKSGLIGMTKSIALAYGTQGVRCNIINPGDVNTDIGANSGGYSERGRAHLLSLIGGVPVIRGGTAADVAQAALWLATEDARFVNGAVLAVDGGFSAA